MFEWDEAKRRTNLIKHRLDFLDVAAPFDGRPRLEGPAAYREEARLFTVAMLDGLFVTLIWTWRDGRRRVISFRRARAGGHAMENEKRIVSYPSAALRAMTERGESETDWEAVRAMTDAEVEAAIASDSDEAGTEIDWSKAVFHPESRKTPMTIRLDADVLAFFRDQGRGYQTRINAVLRAYMEHARK